MANQSLQFKKITTLPATFEKGCVYFYTNGTEKSILLGTGTTGTSYIEFKGTDINTWRAININGTSIGQNAFNIASGTGVTVNDDSKGKATVNLKVATTSEIGGIQLGYTQTDKNYPVQLSNNKAYVNVPWTDTKSFTISATATDDDVVVLTGTNGTNGVTYDAKHAKKGPSNGYTSGNSTTSISGSGASKTIKIPQLTVDAYGHVTTASDEDVTITMPTLPESLKNPNALTFGSKTYDGSEAAEITAADLGLGSILKYCGITTTALTDGAKTNPVVINSVNHTATAGCVVFYEDKEFVFNGTNWELLGAETTYKVVQTAVSSPDASGSAAAFIDTISQDANGKITVTKKNVQFPAAYTLPSAKTNALGGIKVGTVNSNAITASTQGTKYYPVNIDKNNLGYVALPDFKTTDNNTTYSFTGGTNKFTVTPSSGTAYDVTVTPSISNNVTYTGTPVASQIAIFNANGSGVIKSSGYTIATSVPANAVFTDTKYSAGSGLELSDTTFNSVWAYWEE